MKRITNIDQFCAGFSPGDAISNEATLLQDFLRQHGYKSEIYCEQFNEQDADKVHHYREYKDNSNSLLVYHHSYSTRFLRDLPSISSKKILIYHNMTPSYFVRPYNRNLADELELTRRILTEMSSLFESTFSDSAFNESDLKSMGFAGGDIMPVTIRLPVPENGEKEGNPLSFLDDDRLNILFVGRIFPNKKHQDLIKTFYFFKKIRPKSRMIFVGSFHPGVRGYTAELNNLITELNLSNDIIFTGMISDNELYHYYKKSHIFLSMSEHEGFFVPLVESMHFGLPVIAYASSVIPETLGESGVIIHEKDYMLVAELMEKVISDDTLRSGIIDKQRKRASSFSVPQSLSVFQSRLSALGLNFHD